MVHAALPQVLRALLLCLLASLGTVSATAAPRIEVETDRGVVVGQLQRNDVASFLGIPYAAPPVGDLRFRAPQPHAPWPAPIDASQYGSPCPQSARLGSPSLNEDCLYLNVWTVPYGRRRPVLVFIHGGSFNSGNGGLTSGGPSYDGSAIVEQSGAIVVTINYRLSILGYLTSPALDAENPHHVSGNYGLQDQTAALQWVHDNIARFGGDPNNVTLFGESAGGISVLYQLVSPAAAGLFQRAIVESSDDGASVSLAVAEALEAPVIGALGCGTASDVAACLRALPVATIINSGINLGPLIDGVTVPQAPTAAFASGQFNRVPVIAGTNANEGTYFIAVATIAAGRALTATDVTNTLAADYGTGATAIAAAYPTAAYDTPGDALAAIATDSFFACPTDNVRRLLAKSVPVYGYEFSEPNPVQNFPLPKFNGGPVPGITFGDSHTTELAYVFGHDGAGRKLFGIDRTLSNQIIAFWTGFAETGSPDAGDGGFFLVGARHWPLFRVDQPTDIELREPIGRSTTFAAAHHCDLWKSLGYPEVLIESVPTP